MRRRRRLLHPDGRSFAGELRITGISDARGAGLFERAESYRATVRVSKGIGTRGSRLDVRGLAVRVHLPGRDLDLLLSTAGRGRISRHLPVLRRSFDTMYGSITAYRSGPRRKVYLAARPDPDGPALGRALRDLGAGDRLLLEERQRDVVRPVGRITLGRALTAEADEQSAFDAIRNSLPDLHPIGLVHGVRAFAYRWSQRRRHAAPVPANPAAVARTTGSRGGAS